MPTLNVQLVTAERKVVDEQADMVIAPGGAGEIGILPRHIPLITTLKPGELRVRRGQEEQLFAVGGGFLEVRNIEQGSEVIILADSAERAEDLDAVRAEEAKKRAQQFLADQSTTVDAAAAAAALQRALVRLRVIERRRGHQGRQQQG
ncbi:MAG TPA: F0F1 ATP synthase subunit epsilon [Chloroflexota bacterium]|nr:F0F1 ATP synthase subunit epsilon [Chloroflexota bacterium]